MVAPTGMAKLHGRNHPSHPDQFEAPAMPDHPHRPASSPLGAGMPYVEQTFVASHFDRAPPDAIPEEQIEIAG